ncbi:MAG: aspartate--tRNA ligase [Planctomycetota bacterium]|nr:aspartate--tRNA ligase [Planctomycetota bacterium]
MANKYRTHTCGELRGADAGKRVRLSGWVESLRRHGGVAFASLRDRYGVTQLRLDTSKPLWNVFANLTRESVVCVSGLVQARPSDARNPNMKTGEIEVAVEEVEVLSAVSSSLPFEIKEAKSVEPAVRFKYRYLEMREGSLIETLVFRHRLFSKIREFLSSEGFVEVETPCLTRSTPEGARDYLVPSRVHAGKFYALPQSPQLFKQLLMVGGLDKYFQIARCFRDEDLRADRQPEFTQLDVEMAFVEEEDVYDLVEHLICFVVEQTVGERLKRPFKRISYEDALLRYGSDAPDIRFGMEISDLSDIAAKSKSEILLSVLEKKGVVRGLCVNAALSRKELSLAEEVVKSCGAKGILHFHIEADGVRSPFAKFFDSVALDALKNRFDAKAGDTILVVADEERPAQTALGYLRKHLAQRLNIPRNPRLSFLWVVDWKLVELDEEGVLTNLHHPFTSPHPDDLERLESEPLSVRARAYDIVLNGSELGGGSIRIHNPDIQMRILKLLGLDEKTARDRFGFLLDALKSGAPPHGGIALGLDRFTAFLLGFDSITDVIAFPKTRQATCPLTDSPNEVTEEQLRDLHISIVKEKNSLS